MNDDHVKIANIGTITIGASEPVRIAMEIGTYFGTDIGIARDYISFAKEIGVDFLKTEILHDLSIIHDKKMLHSYHTDEGVITENYHSLLARKRLSLKKDYARIMQVCRDIKMPVIASVYDMKGVDFLVQQGAAAAKIASQNITHRPLIEHCAKSGLALIMDTGNALLEEVANAVNWAEKCGITSLVLNHRPDGSPCPADRQNLRIMQRHEREFGWPVGLSCHYDGDEIIYTAIGLGARLIEKPIYHKRQRDDQDTMFTLYYEDFKHMVRKIRNCSSALGQAERQYQIPYQLECRPCIIAGRDLKSGHMLNELDLSYAWPMEGIPAQRFNEVVGLRIKENIRKGTPIGWDSLEKD